MREAGKLHDGSLALDGSAQAALFRIVEQALERADSGDVGVLASLTVSIDPQLDVSAAVLGARRVDDHFFCFEQPDRNGFALAGLGQAKVVCESGPSRFEKTVKRTRELARTALVRNLADDRGAPPGSGPAWVGGFAFADSGASAPEWASLGSGRMIMPEVSLARAGKQSRLTLNAVVEPGDDAGEVSERLKGRLERLGPAQLALIDPDPVEKARVATAAPPEHYEEAVARAVEHIERGNLSKIVLAREVRVHTSQATDPGSLFGALRSLFSSCYCYLQGRGSVSFVGASPELLVRREGARAQTVALAGTTRRSADPSVDSHLGEQLLQSDKDRHEQAIVADRIQRKLEPLSVWVACASEPALVKVHNVQHLATPIRAQLAEPVACLELAGRLHPTPAVGGEPWEKARPLIPALEGIDRGWYSGPVGWTDLYEDGEFCVALRCALLRDGVSHLYAGDGIVSESVPASELQETEVKLAALLPLLA